MSAATRIFVRRLGMAVGVLIAFAAALYLAAVAYLYINSRPMVKP